VRLAENFAAAAHELSPAARTALAGIETRHRYVTIESWSFPGVTYTGDSFWH
jgi:alcohol dehydrogenase (NADP+)